MRAKGQSVDARVERYGPGEGRWALGRWVMVDPATHSFRFTHDKYVTKRRQVTVRTWGERIDVSVELQPRGPGDASPGGD